MNIYIYIFVKDKADKDERIEIIQPTQNIKAMLERVGYPFKSKEHSLRVDQFNRGSNGKYIKKYTRQVDYKSTFICPKILLYQFEEKGKYNYSNKCCYELKKKPFHQWEKRNNKSIAITGMRADEGGNRQRLGCIITSGDRVIRFHPLIKVNDEWEEWFIKEYNIELCKLYYEPYNFERTGCKGCPFSLNLQEQLETMGRLLPDERKQCEMIWKPVYDEYRRIGYRLKKDEQTKLF